MKSIPNALAQILPAFSPCARVRVGLHDAQGLYLTDDVVARVDLPSFDNSAMDGYAVRSADVVGAAAGAPVALPVVGESRAGGPPPAPLATDSAMRIFTGAPMPKGADAIVMQEDTERDGDVVRVKLAVPVGHHVRRRAENVAAGAVILRAGARLDPGAIGLLASQHHAAASVHRRPRVAVLSTGDELRDVSDPPEPGTIVNSNAYALAAQVREAGGVPWVLPTAPDVPEAIAAAVREGLQADVLLSIGGVSVGEYDFVRAAFEEAGVEQRFWKVAIKPGKPISFGVGGGTPVFGLPGNPVSASVTFEVFVRPGLRRMLGDPAPFRRSALVVLADDLTRKTGRTELARGTWVPGEVNTVRLQRGHGSGSVPSMAGIDLLVILPAGQGAFSRGERVRAIRLDGRSGVSSSPFSEA